MHAEISVRVTPRSSRNKIQALTDSSVRAWVMSAPTDGQANEALIELFASTLKVSKSRISIIRGHTSRSKVVQVDGLDLATCMALLG